MKKFIELSDSSGYESGSRCRRERVAGRLELLTAFFDGPPFWMIRLRGGNPVDREYLASNGESSFGNFHWRFTSRETAEKQFEKLVTLPKYAKEAQNALKLRESMRERALARVIDGKLKPFQKSTEK